jgi:hypothetical protein
VFLIMATGLADKHKISTLPALIPWTSLRAGFSASFSTAVRVGHLVHL